MALHRHYHRAADFRWRFPHGDNFQIHRHGVDRHLYRLGGISLPLFLAWVAAFFELALALCFLTGAFFTEASLLAAAYVIFLAFAFHGPSRWEGNQSEFGFFIDHFTFCAGLLLAAVHGPGRRLAVPITLIGSRYEANARIG